MMPMNPEETAHERTTYEVGFLIVPSVAEEALGAEVGRIRETIERASGAIVGEGYPSLRGLHYAMAQRRQGAKQNVDQAYFGYVKFTLEPERAVTVKADIEKIDTILRSLLIIAGKENPIMPKRAPRISAGQASGTHTATPLDAAAKRSLTAEDEVEIIKGIEELLAEKPAP